MQATTAVWLQILHQRGFVVARAVENGFVAIFHALLYLMLVGEVQCPCSAGGSSPG